MRILIVDDEPLARLRLRHLVADLGGHEVVGEASDGAAALDAVNEHSPQVVLIDVRMPGMDGLKAAAAMRTLPARPVVVFVTAYDGHAVAAFEAEATDYLLKPVRRERLAEALERAERQWALRSSPAPIEGGERYLSSVVRGTVRRVPLSEVRVLQAEHKYVTVLWPGGELIIEISLKALETEHADLLLRIHRNTLVGIRHVESLSRDLEGNPLVHVRDHPAPLPVSRRLVADVKRRLRL
jgi:two-component system, LytTR family, response regulator AlgR